MTPSSPHGATVSAAIVRERQGICQGRAWCRTRLGPQAAPASPGPAGAARRNRPPGGFSGLRPLAPASPGRPAAGPFLGSAPLLHRLPLTLPRGGLPSGQKFTFIADKIAGTTPPCLSQKPSNIIANNLRFSREPLFERGSPPPSLRRGLFFWWTTPPLMRYTGDGNLPRR